MKTNRKLEIGATLGLVTLYVGMAHFAAAEKMAHTLLAAGNHVSPLLFGYVVLLVALRFLVVIVLPGVVAARLGLLAWGWLGARHAAREPAGDGEVPATPEGDLARS